MCIYNLNIVRYHIREYKFILNQLPVNICLTSHFILMRDIKAIVYVLANSMIKMLITPLKMYFPFPGCRQCYPAKVADEVRICSLRPPVYTAADVFPSDAVLGRDL
jgi:hypothetical protein